MTPRSVWLLPLLVAACSSGPQGDSPQAVCQRQAYDDPKVRQLVVEDMDTYSINRTVQYDLNRALREATDSCLRQKGVAVRGGVEPVRPY